ncbi:MAG TPA: hypothetical protein VGH87_11130 [Polyangiaceae bacterium]
MKKSQGDAEDERQDGRSDVRLLHPRAFELPATLAKLRDFRSRLRDRLTESFVLLASRVRVRAPAFRRFEPRVQLLVLGFELRHARDRLG